MRDENSIQTHTHTHIQITNSVNKKAGCRCRQENILEEEEKQKDV